jgi:RimJ/RimL family protein N-acetyltransferase
MRPELPSERLELRPAGPDDALALRRHWSHAEVRRFLWDGEPVTEAIVDAMLNQSEEDFDREGFGLWIIRMAGRPRLIGCCGLRAAEDIAAVELLYSLHPDHWGRGLAAEAAGAVLALAFGELGLPAVVACADPRNAPSIRLLETLGMRPTQPTERRIPGRWFTVTRTEWLEVTADRQSL